MIINYFSASFCQPCKTFWPIVNKVAEELDLWVVKEEVDSETYVDKFGIRGVPCVVITDDCGGVIDMRQGAMSEGKFREWVKSYESA